MAKKPQPKLTYKEILCLAIKELDHEIQGYEDKVKGRNLREVTEVVEGITNPLREKRELLCTLYQLETGTEYC